MATTITMPSLGESVAEGEVGKWLVQKGQQVEKDQPLVEIMTDKADSEIPATEGGVITEIFAQEGDMVSVGDKLCEIDPSAEASADAGDGDGDADSKEAAGGNGAGASAAATASSESDAITSPAVRKLARERGVDLAHVSGTG